MRSSWRCLDLEGSLIFVLQSWTHVHRAFLSSSLGGLDRIALRRDRPRIGANDITVKKMSLKAMSGVVNRDWIDCGDGEGVDATCWRMSPI